MYRFCSETNSFYPHDMKDLYVSSGSWPEGGVDVSNDVFLYFSSPPPDGKVRGSDNEGKPGWVDAPIASRSCLIEQAETLKQSLMVEINMEIYPIQDAVDLDIATSEEKDLLLAMKKYRVLLSRVDASKAPDISWPEKDY